MSRRTVWIIAGLVALLAAVGVTTAVAGSAGSNAPSATKATTTKSATTVRKSTRSKQASPQGDVTQSPSAGKSAAEYWTPERMQDVQARELTVPGGTPSAAPSSPVRSAGAASTTSKRTQKAKTQKRTASKRTTAAQQDGVTSGKATGSAADYWTPEQMANVTPMGPTAPGGNGSSQGSDSGIRSASTP